MGAFSTGLYKNGLTKLSSVQLSAKSRQKRVTRHTDCQWTSFEELFKFIEEWTLATENEDTFHLRFIFSLRVFVFLVPLSRFVGEAFTPGLGRLFHE
jgi:hypothetical protein